ncbi:MAG: fatty acid kinase [Gaiellaceae bacterium]|nr:fatty acid kinase [Gaiellaceae bacterium]
MNDLPRLRELAGAALAALEANRARIDDLNVYPVPDGDTGTNLTQTLRSVVADLDNATDGTRPELARAVTRAALMGARGNSGVIFSQIVRGAAESLGETSTFDAASVARALRAASDAAYRAVKRPVEGTILTVVREMAEEAETREADVGSAGELLVDVVRRGEEALARTPDQLPILKEAGVVDAGGAGLLEIVRGLTAAVSGEPIPEAQPAQQEAGVDAIHQELSRYRYCTVFVIEGEALDQDGIEQELDSLGDSLLVVGDPSALKVHVHTDEPGRALAIGTAVGVIEGIEIANMHRQTEAREERLLHAVPELEAEPAASAVVAVVAGEGNRRLFESLGASVIVEGGQTMNPATSELVAAIESAPAGEVVLLPNNANVILSAEQAAGLADRHVEVVASESIPAGLAAMVAFDPSRSAVENARELRDAIAGVATAEVTIASRDVELDGLAIRKGSWLGLADGRAVAGGVSFDEVADAVVERLLAEPRGVLTLLKGADEPELEGLLARLAERHPDLELDVQDGGQPHYPLLISAE